MNKQSQHAEDLPAAEEASEQLRGVAQVLARWHWLGLAALGNDVRKARRGKSLWNNDKEVLYLLDGIEPEVFEKMSPDEIAEACRTRHEYAIPEAKAALNLLRERMRPLAEQLCLNPVEADLMIFIAVKSTHDSLETICNAIKATTTVEAAKILAPFLKVDAVRLAKVLRGSDGSLFRCGLLMQMLSPDAGCLERFLSATPTFVGGFFSGQPINEYMLHHLLSATTAQKRSAADYIHLDKEIRLIKAVLNGAESTAHVLIVGSPGVGKTELARWIAHSLEWKALEVRDSDNDGDPQSRDKRFRHYALGCRLLGQCSDTLVIFDEAEDVFVGDHWTHVGPQQNRHKGWTNRLLESTRIPTIWISNSIRHIDPAYVRRFDYVLELKSPPRSVRLQMVRSAVRNLAVDPALVERIAESDRFTPSDADRIGRILPRAVLAGLSPDAVLTQLAVCRPGGVTRSELVTRRATSLPYKLEWINVPADITQLVAGLRVRGAGTLAFSGPPGTGKTELARHIAQVLDRPLHIKKASDLLSPYVGETEAQIAEAFETASHDGAVLLLDEADSFLRDRSLASRSWEATQVNEMLAQLDGYPGIAILTTNFTDTLDRAVLRRMDVKLSFGYLRPEHAWEAFIAALNELDIPKPSEDSEIASRVHLLRELTLGDYSASIRGFHLTARRADAESFYTALCEEIRCKGGMRRGIGFSSMA